MICIVDYGMGNLRSVAKALEKVGGEVLISARPEDLKAAQKVVLPGVGAFGDASHEIRRRNLFGSLRETIQKKKPFLGVCLGMQLLFNNSEESPGVEGLGIFPGRVRRFQNQAVKIPHMGWNQVTLKKPGAVAFRNVPDQSFFYFVHSYYPVPEDPALIVGTAEYGGEVFPAFVGNENVWASQFHPEKSQEAGLQILRNFVAL